MNKLKLFNFYRNRIKQNSYIGLDFNMAVCCIIAKRTKLKMSFMPHGSLSYEEKLEGWAKIRHFGEVWFGTEDQILKAAWKNYLASNKA